MVLEARGYRQKAPESRARIVELAASRIPGATTAGSPGLAIPSAMLKKETLSAKRTFFRYSAWNPDRRVDPKTGDFLAGTYATTEADVPFATTGFGAVGRYALPNVMPASVRYTIEAPVGTVVWFGTVAPQYNQAGGGVEVYFPNSVTNQARPVVPPKVLPDD